MNCEKYIDLMSLYIDGELDDKMMADFEKHITHCISCREEVEFFRMISMSNLQAIQPPQGFHEDLMKKLELEEKTLALPINNRRWFKNIKLIGALAAVFVFSMILIKPLKMDLFNDQVPEMLSMEESLEDSIEESVEESIEKSIEADQIDKDSQESIIESRIIEPPQEKIISLPEELKDKPEKAPKKISENIARDSVKDSAKDIVESPENKALVEEPMPARQEARVFSLEEQVPQETWIFMAGDYLENKDYMTGLMEDLGIEAQVTETTGTKEVGNQSMTIETTVTLEEKSQLEVKLREDKKTVEKPDDEKATSHPERIQLIIIIKER